MNYTIYGKPNCQKCTMVKSILDSKKISYSYKDLTEDEDKMAEFVSKGLRELPVVENPQGKLGGFNELITEINGG